MTPVISQEQKAQYRRLVANAAARFHAETLRRTILNADPSPWHDRDSLKQLADAAKDPIAKIALLDELKSLLEAQKEAIEQEIAQTQYSITQLQLERAKQPESTR